MSIATKASARPASAEPLLARLKAETTPLHARVERLVPLLRPGLDRHGYRAYLGRLLGYLRPLEAALSSFGPAWANYGIDFEARRKSELVVSDLLALGATAAEIVALPQCASLPAVGSLEQAWGCLYVLEGSTLGGQIVLRTLGPRLRLARGDGLSFLAGYAEQTGSTWKAFAAAVGLFDAPGCDREAVVSGASDTFSTMMAWLAEGPRLD